MEADAPQGVKLQRPKPIMPPTGEDAMVYGPTSRPNEAVTTNRSPALIPDYVFKAIPALVRAAAMPDAPPALLAMLRLIDYNVNRKP